MPRILCSYATFVQIAKFYPAQKVGLITIFTKKRTHQLNFKQPKRDFYYIAFFYVFVAKIYIYCTVYMSWDWHQRNSLYFWLSIKIVIVIFISCRLSTFDKLRFTVIYFFFSFFARLSLKKVNFCVNEIFFSINHKLIAFDFYWHINVILFYRLKNK